MSWREIKTDDVLGYFTPAEKSMLQNILNGADTLSPKITDGVGSIRGFIQAGANQLDATSATTVPDQLRDDAIAYIAWNWLRSFPALEKFKTKERGDAAKEAKTLFKLIGSKDPNRPQVEIPAVSSAQPAPVDGTQVVHHKRHRDRWTDKKMNGF